MSSFLERLGRGPLLCDGAMGTLLYAKGVFINRCYDELNLSQPEIVGTIHADYVKAGAEVLETNTFGANRYRLLRHGYEARVGDINRAGVQLARAAAGSGVLVAGSVGPLGLHIEPLGKVSREEAQAAFREQIEVLAAEGVDLILLETFGYIDELHQAVLAARAAAPGVPVVAQVTIDEDGNALDGTDPETFGVRLTGFGVDVVGCNCSVGPAAMLETVERLRRVTPLPLSAQPNAGMPRNVEGRNIYLCSPEYMASYARKFVAAGVSFVGGCCGTTPEHIKAMKSALRVGEARSSSFQVTVAEPCRFPGGEAAGGALQAGTQAGCGRVCDHGRNCPAQGNQPSQGTGSGAVSARRGHRRGQHTGQPSRLGPHEQPGAVHHHRARMRH